MYIIFTTSVTGLIKLQPLRAITGVMTQSPDLQISYQPQNPTNRDKIVFKVTSNNPGSIKKVVFFRKAVKVGEDSTSPWTYIGGPYPAGIFTFGAGAYDDSGNQIARKYTSVRVKMYDIQLSITYSPASPTNRNIINFKADSPEKDFIRKIVFFAKAIKVGEDTAYPWTYKGGPYPPERFTFGTVAYDASGNNIGRKYTSVMVKPYPFVLTLSHSPTSPTTNTKITFTTQASDAKEIKKNYLF